MSSFEHQKLDGLLAAKMADYLIAQTPGVDNGGRNALISALYGFIRNGAGCQVWAHAFGWPPQEHEED